MDLSLFKKIEFGKSNRCYNREKVIRITENKNGTPNRITISGPVAVEAGFKEKDRMDLYNFGSMFALKKESAGCLTARISSKTSNSLIIGNTNAAIEISAKTNKARIFDAWVEDKVIFFKPREEK